MDRFELFMRRARMRARTPRKPTAMRTATLTMITTTIKIESFAVPAGGSISWLAPIGDNDSGGEGEEPSASELLGTGESGGTSGGEVGGGAVGGG